MRKVLDGASPHLQAKAKGTGSRQLGMCVFDSKIAFFLYFTYLDLLLPQGSRGTLSLCSHSPWLKKPWLGETTQKSLGRLPASLPPTCFGQTGDPTPEDSIRFPF